MLKVLVVDAAKAVPLFWGFYDVQLAPSSWETFCREKGLSALAPCTSSTWRAIQRPAACCSTAW